MSRQQQDQDQRAWARANPEAARRQARTNREVGMGLRANEVIWRASCRVDDCEFTAEAKGDEDAVVATLKTHHDASHPEAKWQAPDELDWEADDDATGG